MRHLLVATAAAGVLACAVSAAGAKGFALTSAAFAAGAPIPRVYTCDGRNVSPPLRWTDPPAGTRSFAILMDDPDAPGGTFTHWLGWNIPATARSLRVGQHAPVEGTNDAQRIGYVGPCPPSGRHRYVFHLYALRAPLRLAAGSSRSAFLAALRGKTLAVARLVGPYAR